MIGATQNQEVILASQTLVSVPRLTSMVIRGKEAKRRMKTISFVSQNVRGIKSVNRLEELFYVLSQRKNVGVSLQETCDLIKTFLNMNLTE